MASRKIQLNLVSMLALCDFCFVPGALLAQGKCASEVAKEWISSHSDHLPETYDELIKIPLRLRRALVAELSPYAQSALWRSQFRLYMEESLDVDQSQVLEDAIRLASPRLFGVLQQRRGEEYEKGLRAVKGLEERVIEAFGRDKAREILYQLGPSVGEQLTVQEGSSIEMELDCECNILADACSIGRNCVHYDSLCKDSSWGCGRLGMAECHGRCVIEASTE